MSGQPGGFTVETTGELLREGTDRLAAAGSETPRLDAELLLGHAVGAGRTAVVAHPEAPVGADAARRYRADLERRAAGEPVAYMRGIKEFYGLAFEVDARALIPRPETETPRRAGRGRGHAAARRRRAAAREPRPPGRRRGDGERRHRGRARRRAAAAQGARRGRILAVDISPDALGLARENAVGHAVADRISFAEADLLPGRCRAAFDVVLANLPYVRHDAMAGLPVATSFEPALALDGGVDGLEVIGRLLDRLPATPGR